MTDLLKILDTDSFWNELDKNFYQKFPEEWDNGSEMVVSHEGYTAIIEGKTDRYTRPHTGEEQEITTHWIKRDGYRLWSVGKEYTVKHHEGRIRQAGLSCREINGCKVKDSYSIGINQDNVIGKIRLIYIQNGMQSDDLIFEVVK